MRLYQGEIRHRKLSRREQQCLLLAGQDKSLVETAENLNLSSETVRTYRKMLLRKLNCKTIAGALYVAIQQGILNLKQ